VPPPPGGGDGDEPPGATLPPIAERPTLPDTGEEAANDQTLSVPVIPRGLAQQHLSVALTRLVDSYMELERISMAIASGLDAMAADTE
jgi:hypothetical protein